MTGNTTVPGTSASFTYAGGSYVQATRVFTVASGDPASDGVAVGDFAAIDTGGATAAYIARVSARTSTTITLVATGHGTNPANGTYTLRIGGAFKGPNAAENFPFGFLSNNSGGLNSSGHPARINMMNAANFDVTAAVTHNVAGPIWIEGFSAAYGDGGRAQIDGGTSGAAYALFTVSGGRAYFKNMIFANNGASSTAALFTASTSGQVILERCVFHDSRGNGLLCSVGVEAIECEAYACNASNTANTAGFNVASVSHFQRCIAHDNTGSNTAGFYQGNANIIMDRCISESNGNAGLRSNSNSAIIATHCDFYNNGGSGIDIVGSGNTWLRIENCNFVKNSAYGIVDQGSGGSKQIGSVQNCGFGSGTQANTSGATSYVAGSAIEESGSITYAADVTPWVDPANGDFRISLAAAKGTGRGAFTQTAASYAGTVGYPDVGASQHLESASGSGANPIGLGSPVVRGV